MSINLKIRLRGLRGGKSGDTVVLWVKWPPEVLASHLHATQVLLMLLSDPAHCSESSRRWPSMLGPLNPCGIRGRSFSLQLGTAPAIETNWGVNQWTEMKDISISHFLTFKEIH